MILLVIAATFYWEPIDKSTFGHISTGYVAADITKNLCKNESLWKQNTNAILVSWLVGYSIEMFDEKKSATDLMATMTGGIFKVIFDWIFREKAIPTKNKKNIEWLK